MPKLCTGDDALGGVSIDTFEGDMMDWLISCWDLSGCRKQLKKENQQLYEEEGSESVFYCISWISFILTVYYQFIVYSSEWCFIRYVFDMIESV